MHYHYLHRPRRLKSKIQLDNFVSRYDEALNRSNQMDSNITTVSRAAVSGAASNYTDLLALAIRQGFAASDITIGLNGQGGCNMSDVMMFLQENGDPQNPNARYGSIYNYAIRCLIKHPGEFKPLNRCMLHSRCLCI